MCYVEACCAVGLFLLNCFKMSSPFKQYDNQQPKRKSELVTVAVATFTQEAKGQSQADNSFFFFFLLKG